MALNTPNATLPYPELSDIPNAQTGFQNLALALDTKVVPKFASSSARDTAIGTPVDGQLVYRTDIKGYQTYKTGTGWLPAGVVTCTSVTRPGSPETGRHIYETDTLCNYVYSGSAWRMLGTYRRTQVLGSAAASVTFSSIPTSLKCLRVSWTARCDAAGGAFTLTMQPNANATANYYGQYVSQVNTAYTANGVATATSARVGIVPGTAAVGATIRGTGTIEIPDWSASGARLSFSSRTTMYDTAANSYLENGGWLLYVDGPYTSLKFAASSGNLITGSEFVLEGWD